MKRRKKIYSVLLMLLFIWPNFIFCQEVSVVWESCFGGSKFEYCSDILMVEDTYYTLAETMSTDGNVSYNHGPKDIWLIKTDNTGNMLFEKCFGGTKGDGASNILKITDSTFYIGGATKSNDGDISYNPDPSSFNFWIFKFDDKGNIIWDKVVGGSRHEQTRDAIVTNNGGILQMGLTNSDDGDITNYYGSNDIWMVKLTSTGELDWDFTLGGSGGEAAGAIILTSDGGYMVAAATDGAGGGNYDTACNFHGTSGGGFLDAWIVKLDSLRNIEWQQCYGGKYLDNANDISELDDGYIVVGSTISNDGDVSGFHGWPGDTDYGDDIWVFKIDFVGNLLWQKCLGGYSDDYSQNIFSTSDGGFMVVGRTTSDDGDVIGYHGEQTGLNGDIWLVKLSADGELQWQFCYGGAGDERIYHGVIQKSDYNYVMAIETDTDPWQCGGMMYFDVRVLEIDDTVTSTIEHEVPKESFELTVHPNPAQSTVTFTYHFRKDILTFEIEIWNSSGQLLATIPVRGSVGKQEFDISQLPAGIYFYTIKTNRTVTTGKMVVSR